MENNKVTILSKTCFGNKMVILSEAKDLVNLPWDSKFILSKAEESAFGALRMTKI